MAADGPEATTGGPGPRQTWAALPLGTRPEVGRGRKSIHPIGGTQDGQRFQVHDPALSLG